MKGFIVATDSGCDLPISLLCERDIYPLMMACDINGELIRDTMRPEDARAFYERMRRGDTPRTSQITEAEFLDFWTPLVETGLPVLHISMGSGISGTYDNGLRAAESIKTGRPNARILLVDSTLASVGYGMLALEAAKLRDSGATAGQCAAYLNAIKGGINTWFTTCDLTYLYRSGRVSRAGMAVAHALGICPILNLDAEGHLIVRDRVRGPKAAVNKLTALISQGVLNPEAQTLYVCHSDAEEKARTLGERLITEIGFKDAIYTYIGATIGAHAGPGLLAAFYSGKPR